MIDFAVWSFENRYPFTGGGCHACSKRARPNGGWPSSPVECRGNEAVAEPERAEYLHSFPPRKRPCFRSGHIGLSAFL